jgi:hypothetical protein
MRRRGPTLPRGRRIVCRVCGEVVPRCTLPVDECADCYGETEARRNETPGVVPGVRSAIGRADRPRQERQSAPDYRAGEV